MQYFDTHAHIGLICEDPIEQLIVIQEARQAS
ncbi:MAG: hydrolase TatD, partial [Treponema sp.]|nr:hydrolase TatD [Treponema sp.]